LLPDSQYGSGGVVYGGRVSSYTINTETPAEKVERIKAEIRASRQHLVWGEGDRFACKPIGGGFDVAFYVFQGEDYDMWTAARGFPRDSASDAEWDAFCEWCGEQINLRGY